MKNEQASVQVSNRNKVPRFNSPNEGCSAKAWQGGFDRREPENEKRILLGGYTTWKHPGEEFVRISTISAACVCVRLCAGSTRPQANTWTLLLIREIATRPRRFKRPPNEVWLRKARHVHIHTGQDRATPLSITPRATKQIKRLNTRGYSGAFPTGGMQPERNISSSGEVFLCASGLSDCLGQESIALSTRIAVLVIEKV